MTPPIDRTTLEGEFRSDELLTLPEAMVEGIEHAASVDFLRNVGLPVRANPWFDLIDTSRRDLKKVGTCYEDFALDYLESQVPGGGGRPGPLSG
ncbi:hypothetical protein [Streptomyces decoyicus]|uniref:hypothetical protein n=1 Tax=Streptomyces decoyicus TaxID=249567 RepID=UPI0038116E30